MKRTLVALVILHALLVNPERYKYIASLASELSEDGVTKKYTNRELTEKNLNKAFKMSDQFLSFGRASVEPGDARGYIRAAVFMIVLQGLVFKFVMPMIGQGGQ